MEKFVIAVYVDNQFGVLTRVTSMFTRRGFNIDSLTVGETETPAYSRITITMSGTGYARDQLINQLRKVENNAATRQDVLAAVDIFRAKIIDYSPTALCIEVTGDPSKISAFIENMKPYGILELCRTGVVALERGAGSMLEKTPGAYEY